MTSTLVIGGTGKVGSLLVPKLIERAAAVRVLTRTTARVAGLGSGVESFVADVFSDPKSAAPAFSEIEAVYMLNQPGPQELAEGLFLVQLAKEAGVRRFVYQSAFHAEELAFIPHIASKVAIANALRTSGVEWTLICPNYFFQNDLAARPALERGVHPSPIGDVGCSAVDAGDIAQAAAIVLTEAGHEGQSYNIVGPEVLTGERMAAEWSAALGRPVRPTTDVDTWEQASLANMPPWFHYDLSLMLRRFGEQGYKAGPGDLQRVTQLLGRAPRRYKDFVEETAASWSSAKA